MRRSEQTGFWMLPAEQPMRWATLSRMYEPRADIARAVERGWVIHTLGLRSEANCMTPDRLRFMRFIRRRARTSSDLTPIRWNFASITIRSSLNESVWTPLQDADIASGRSEVTTVSSKRVTVRWSFRLTESP